MSKFYISVSSKFIILTVVILSLFVPHLAYSNTMPKYTEDSDVYADGVDVNYTAVDKGTKMSKTITVHNPTVQKLNKIKSEQNLMSIAPSKRLYPLENEVVPNDPYYAYSSSYPLKSTSLGGSHFDQVWSKFGDYSQTDSSVKIGVIDTGFLTTESNADNTFGHIKAGCDFSHQANSDTAPLTCESQIVSPHSGAPSSFHGVNVSHIIGASANNSNALSGAGWNTEVVVYRVQDEDGDMYDDSLSNAILWAAKHDHVKVINISLGFIDDSQGTPGSYPDSVRIAIDEVVKNDNVVVVAASGNNGDTSHRGEHVYPASDPNVISVGAATESGDRAVYSQYNDQLDLIAAGSNVISLSASNDHMVVPAVNTSISGTSFSAPYVSAAAALIMRANNSLNANQVRDCLLSGASNANARNDEVGYGVLNVANSLNMVYSNTCANEASDPEIPQSDIQPDNSQNNNESDSKTPVNDSNNNSNQNKTNNQKEVSKKPTNQPPKNVKPPASSNNTKLPTLPISSPKVSPSKLLTPFLNTIVLKNNALSVKWDKVLRDGKVVNNAIYYAILSSDLGDKSTIISRKLKATFNNLKVGKYLLKVYAKDNQGISNSIIYKFKVRLTKVKIYKKFSDVKKKNYFYSAVKFLYTRNLVKGVGTKFNPNKTVTRKVAAQFLYALFKPKTYQPAKISVYKDVLANNEFFSAIAYLKSRSAFDKVIKTNLFKPNKPIKRYELASLIYKLVKSPKVNNPPLAVFADVKKSNKYIKEITFLYNNNITTGISKKGKRYFNPNDKVSRSQMATFIYRIYNNYLLK